MKLTENELSDLRQDLKDTYKRMDKMFSKINQYDSIKCDDCGNYEVSETIYPYMNEIYGDEIECNLCNKCYYERCMAI